MLVSRPPRCVVLAFLAAALSLLGGIGVARACTIDCNPPTACTCSGTGTCTIQTNQTEAAGAIVDCSGRDVVIAGGSIQVTDGFLTLRADDLTINQQSFMKAQRSVGSTAPFGLHLELTGTLDLDGWIHAKSDAGGGLITVRADGVVNVQPGGTDAFNADGTATDAPGGRVEIASGSTFDLGKPISANAALTGTAEGGEVVLSAATSLTISAPITALGRQSGAGRIVLDTPGTLTIQDQLKAEGHGADVVDVLGGLAVYAVLRAARRAVRIAGVDAAGWVRVPTPPVRHRPLDLRPSRPPQEAS